MISKPQKIQLSLTIHFAIFFIALSAFVYFFFSRSYEESVYENYKYKSQIFIRYLQQNPQIFERSKIVNNNELVQLSHLNDVVYYVLMSDKGDVLDAVNLREAEHYMYLRTKESNNISFDGLVYQLVLPVEYGNEDKLGQIYLGYKAGQVTSDLKNKTLKTAFYSFLLLLAGILFTYILSSFSFRPIIKLYSALSKTDRDEQKQLLENFKDDEVGSVAKKIYDMVVQIDQSSSQVDNLNEQLKEVFREKIYELDIEISHRKKAETYMKKTEEMFKLLFENAPIGMFITSKDGKVIKANKAFCKTLGYDEFDITRTHIKNFFQDDPPNRSLKTYQMVLENESLDLECNVKKRNGKKISALVKTIKINDIEGKPTNVLLQVLDITQIKNVQAELVSALDKAKEADRLKSAFLAQMSHEIRTPLNVILPSIPILADEVGTKDQELVTILNAVGNASKRLQRTIDMILSISAVQSGNYKVRYETFNLAEDLELLTQEFKSIVNEKSLKLYFTNTSTYPDISADRYTIGQVFQNLMGNAVKYTLAGYISVSIEDYGENKIRVQISDTGIGISEKYLKNLFSPFSQEDTGQTRKYEGNGLGLALVKEYVTLNNGQIYVESEKNKGSVFSVIFEKKLIGDQVSEGGILINQS